MKTVMNTLALFTIFVISIIGLRECYFYLRSVYKLRTHRPFIVGPESL